MKRNARTVAICAVAQSILHSVGQLVVTCCVVVWLSTVTADSRPLLGQTDNEEPFSMLNPGVGLPDILSDGTLQPKAKLWLSGSDGNRVFMPDESYRDYVLSNGKSNGGLAGLPGVVLERAELELRVEGDIARLKGDFHVLLTQAAASKVQLDLGSVQLSDWQFSNDAEAQNLIQPTSDEGGWEWILMSSQNTKHSVALQGVTRVLREPDRRSMRITLPTTSCIIRVSLPDNAVDVRVRNEDVLQPTDNQQGRGFVIHSSGGEFSLSWRDQAAIAQVAAIKATSTTEFVITDPSQPWIASTTLSLRWYGEDATDRIRIELPPGAQWRGAPPSSVFDRYQIITYDPDRESSTEFSGRPESTGSGASISDQRSDREGASETTTSAAQLNISGRDGDEDGSPVGELENGSKVDAGPQVARQVILENADLTRYETLEIPLEWEWIPNLQTADPLSVETQIPAPILHGVDQHRGTINCIVPSAYAIVFNEGEAVRLTQQRPLLDGFARQQLQLQFEFDRQAFGLSVVFRREQNLPTVRPTYVVEVDRNKLVLTMWLDCAFDTHQPQMEIGLILDEWLIQENTARVVNDRDDPFSSEGELLRVQQQVDRNYLIRSTSSEVGNYGASRHVDQLWRIVAERSWTAEDKELYLQVPQIIRGQVNGNPETDHGSGALLVTSESNVLLTWQEAASTGLQRDSFSTEYQRYISRPTPRKPLAYRFQSSETAPVWAGKAEMLPRQVSVEQHAELEVVGSTIAVRQNFDLQIANEALSELRIAVRKDLAASQPPQVLINGNLVTSAPVATLSESQLESELSRASDRTANLFLAPVAPLPSESPNSTSGISASGVSSNQEAELLVATATTRPTSEPNAAGTAAVVEKIDVVQSEPVWQTYQLIGNPDLIGPTRIAVLSSLEWKKNGDMRAGENAQSTTGTNNETRTAATDENGPTPIEIPLVQLLLPENSRRMRQDWTLKTDLQVEAVGKADDIFLQDDALGGQRVHPLDPMQKKIELSLRARKMPGISPVRINKSWLQSFVNGQQRRERFVMQVETSAGEIRLRLPKETNIREGEGKVQVSVDGFKQDLYYDQPTDIVTVLLVDQSRKQHVVEISYFLFDRLNWVTRLSVAPPKILGAEENSPFFWQLLTPSIFHLGWSPAELSAEWNWRWSGLYWQRTSELGQRQLEDWVGTVAQDPVPASANSYVMSGSGLEQAMDVWILSRFVLWFPVGMLAIAISFTVLTTASVRKPIYAFSGAAAIAALATVWPDLAALAGQTAVLSLGLVCLVWVVQATVDSRVRRRSVFTTRPSTYIERSDQASVLRGSRPSPPTITHVGSSVANGG